MSRPARSVTVVVEERPWTTTRGVTRARERAQGQAFMVVALSIACSALAIFDLLLLATTG